MISRFSFPIGADPEFFFEKDGKIFESGAVIKDKVYAESGAGTVIKDGFQGEFNPGAVTCRQSFAYNILYCMRKVWELGYDIKLGAGYKIPKSDFADLSGDSKVFGCVPSQNIYGREPIGVDPMTYLFRPAGGHIHLTLNTSMKKNLVKIVKLLDIFVGNTCVAFDQDPLNKERRKNYGRAGEFREKSYGVEYRTLSNFWLNHYVYVSMVYGLARQALSISQHSELVKQVFALVKMEDIEKAINNNDKKLALKNFLKLEQFIKDNFKPVAYEEQIFTLTNKSFDTFYQAMDKGFAFKKTGKDYWSTVRENGLGNGVESYLLNKYVN